MDEDDKERAERELKKFKKEFDELMSKYSDFDIIPYAEGVRGFELWAYDEITCVEVFLR
jgi:hypothetical protein